MHNVQIAALPVEPFLCFSSVITAHISVLMPPFFFAFLGSFWHTSLYSLPRPFVRLFTTFSFALRTPPFVNPFSRTILVSSYPLFIPSNFRSPLAFEGLPSTFCSNHQLPHPFFRTLSCLNSTDLVSRLGHDLLLEWDERHPRAHVIVLETRSPRCM
ncbi:hypothetical protein BDN72DRAFT_85919 [Pluteus cervinus]|uniref:Uncharacterized protein n=1 Tax=Pluteus cervinus TaxID=181527 RepID=A0ACD3AQW8_9AGAR|nr:hypothetical protein BDN72DRAFT_85919 [Pluteus cervinus]